VSPTATARLETEWEDPYTFDPHRFLSTDEDGNVVVTAGEHLARGGKFKWVPFGAGRHRCIGFEFAQIQIRAVWSTLLRKFEFELPEGMPAITAVVSAAAAAAAAAAAQTIMPGRKPKCWYLVASIVVAAPASSPHTPPLPLLNVKARFRKSITVL